MRCALGRVDGIPDLRFFTDSRIRLCSNHCVTGNREPDMLTGMTERDCTIVLEVFDAAQSRRGEPGHDDRKFLEAMHHFTVHSITWRAIGTASGSGSGGSAARGYARHSFNCWRNAARRHTWSSSSTARRRALTSPPQAQKGAASPGLWALARRFLDQNPPQD